jgi:hypothetical protein
MQVRIRFENFAAAQNSRMTEVILALRDASISFQEFVSFHGFRLG